MFTLGAYERESSITIVSFNYGSFGGRETKLKRDDGNEK